MNFIEPDPEELSYLRADPLLSEQELDVRPEVAEAIEKAVGIRAGRVYWRSEQDHLYALELGDLGRGRPSTATVFGHWDRYAPRPPEHEIDSDLLAFLLWVAETSGEVEPSDVRRVAWTAGVQPTWPPGSVLRSPDERFENLPDFPYEPHYVEVESLRMAYVEAGAGDPVLCLHGEPTWGYLYRHMIPVLARAGRVVAPDLIGFGRSDKPAADNAYSYKSHARWLRRFIEALDLQRVTLVCQDWGGLLGLRVVSQMPDRFAGVVAMNTGLPAGQPPGEAFMAWRRLSQQARSLDVPAMMKNAVRGRTLSDAEALAYGAPFPSVEYQTAALVFPRLVPIRPDHPGAHENRKAREVLRGLDIRALLISGAGDRVTDGFGRDLRTVFGNVAPSLTIDGAGHFIQEDRGPEVAEHILKWMTATAVKP